MYMCAELYFSGCLGSGGVRETGRREGESGKEGEGREGEGREREREGEGERETDREHKHTPSTNIHSLGNVLVKSHTS